MCRTIVAALVLVASTLGPAARADDSDKLKIGEFIPAASPQPAPEIFITDMSGTTTTLAGFKGKFVLLNLWATWCQPCLKEMPSLAALQARLGPALTVAAVSEDRGAALTVKPFLEKHNLTGLEIYFDPGSSATHAFGVRGLPTSFVIDGEGRVLGKVEGGADWDSQTMRSTLAGLLPSPEGAAKPQ